MSSTATQPPTRLVGCCGFGRELEEYFEQFTTVEYQQSFLYPPRAKALSRLQRLTPEGFVFVVRAWQLITHEPTSPGYKQLPKPLTGGPGAYGHFRDSNQVLDAYQQTFEVAAALGAEAIFFETPTSFTPTTQNRRAMASFFERIERGQRLMIWDPRGVWSEGEIARICTDLQLIPCQDPFSQETCAPGVPEFPVAYLRLRGLGGAQHVSDDQLTWLVEMTRPYDRAFYIFQTLDMLRDASRLLVQMEPLEPEG
jgi:uncharacterized protein YecE (DUF72 family)